MDDRSAIGHASAIDPRAEYTKRLETSRILVAELTGRDDLLGNVRLVLFLLGAVLGWLAWRQTIGIAWPLAVVAVFVVLIVIHTRIMASRKRAEGRVAYHERGLARLDDRWAGTGVTGDRFLNEEHPYASDLDLFGVGSLFERLCTARTSSGEACLAGWLLRPASVEEIRGRHEAVSELRANLDLREDLALLGDDVRSGVAPETLAAWGATPQSRASVLTRVGLFLLSLATLVTLLGWLIFGWSTFVFLGFIVVEVVVASAFANRTTKALADVEERSGELETLAGLLARIEREPFESARLKTIKETLGGSHGAVSKRIGRLATLVRWLEARHNVYFAMIGSMLLWKTQFGLAIEAWRESEGQSIGRWLEVVGQIEAYASLASFSFENPEDPFPELVEASGGPMIEAEGLGHPLLPRSQVVRNDFKLGGELRVLSISGSNMSGKSTFLRTIGVNVVLAQAGATVRASRLKLSPLTLGGTLSVHDSLQKGQSRFKAEIDRLRLLVEMAKGTPPLLFLIDEVMHGTNSHDRQHGAGMVIKGLIDLGAIGLFTTHDLALAEVAGHLAPRAINVHFADHLDDNGTLVFDYTMRPGVVQHSNALALMRAIGLDV